MKMPFLMLVGILILTIKVSAQTTSCLTFTNLRNSEESASQALQNCLDSLPPSSELFLEPGVWNLDKSVYFRKPIIFGTRANHLFVTCRYSRKHDCAEFRMMKDSDPKNGFGFFVIESNEVKLRSIVLNGNSLERRNSWVYQQCRTGNPGVGYLMGLSKNLNGVSITKSVFKNTMCGTSIAVAEGATDFEFTNNVVAFGGEHRDGAWADGLTIHRNAKNLKLVKNTFIDNTDVDLILGGCEDCTIKNNLIFHSNSFYNSSFAAFMLYAWNEDGGNYRNTIVANNRIECTAGRCGYGLYLGTQSWAPQLSIGGGIVEDNQIANAQIGFSIDPAREPIVIKNNFVKPIGDNKKLVTQRGFLTTLGYRKLPQLNIVSPGTIDIRDTFKIKYSHKNLTGIIPNWHEHDSARNYWGLTDSQIDSLTSAKRKHKKNKVYRKIILDFYHKILGRTAVSKEEVNFWKSNVKNKFSFSWIKREFAFSEESEVNIDKFYLEQKGRRAYPREMLAAMEYLCGPNTSIESWFNMNKTNR